MSRRARRAVGFNLAFLDIMACGLGAVILIFMLVKYQTEQPDTESQNLQAELAQRQNENDALESGNRARAAQVDALKQELQRQIRRAAQADEAAGDAAAEIIELTKEIARLQQQIRQTPAPVPAKKTPVKTPKEDHLLGLRVEGRRIVILLDTSASMADERLLDIVKIKVSDTGTKRAAPKWRRAIAAARWMIDRVPENSEYLIIRYSDKAHFLSGKKWLDGDDADARESVFEALEKLVPQNATNLHAALALMKTNSLSPTDVYVITDSLPTQGLGNLSALKKFQACGLGKKTTVSGECRLALFHSAVQSFSSAAKVNTVLLPIEGDPDAAYAYWGWANATGGLMISPAGSWP